jgi:hypothetical protein
VLLVVADVPPAGKRMRRSCCRGVAVGGCDVEVGVTVGTGRVSVALGSLVGEGVIVGACVGACVGA